MNFSASKLIKRSAKQLVYFEKSTYNKPDGVSARAIQGQRDAEERSEHLQEMRGSYKLGDNLIHFSWDEVFDSDTTVVCIERKMFDGRYKDDWYFDSSVLQTAFYAALTSRVNDLYTATFARKKFGVQHVSLGNKEHQFVLCFGDSMYDIHITSPHMFINHLVDKAAVVKKADYDKAMEWDTKYKHKEYPIFKDYITYEVR